MHTIQSTRRRWLQAEQAARVFELGAAAGSATPARRAARAFLARQLRLVAARHTTRMLRQVRALQQALPLL